VSSPAVTVERFKYEDALLTCSCARRKEPYHFYYCRGGRKTAIHPWGRQPVADILTRKSIFTAYADWLRKNTILHSHLQTPLRCQFIGPEYIGLLQISPLFSFFSPFLFSFCLCLSILCTCSELLLLLDSHESLSSLPCGVLPVFR